MVCSSGNGVVGSSGEGLGNMFERLGSFHSQDQHPGKYKKKIETTQLIGIKRCCCRIFIVTKSRGRITKLNITCCAEMLP